jgi:putative DNA methylase
MQTFIETQFPIARLSAEAYKERKANNSQTLTKIGKWWGRKPLILVRASIIGMLMPASNDPGKDREIFLMILTMDDDGTWQRCKAAAKRKLGRGELVARCKDATDDVRRWLEPKNLTSLTATNWSEINRCLGSSSSNIEELIEWLGHMAFNAMPYSERISHCERPENISGPAEQSWSAINEHLGTEAKSLAELTKQLGVRKFGHMPRVGDSFSGGGSIPFEAARIGCEAFGSDLNPVACLLTWANLNILGGDTAVQNEVIDVQAKVMQATEQQVTEWGIEHNENGERADAFLYCVEVKPEGCEYFIPLSPSWLVGEKSKVVMRWSRVAGSDRLQPEAAVVNDTELKVYKSKKGATVVGGRVVDPFDVDRSWSVEALRGALGLRRWTNEDLISRENDVFQERLYCIRWVDAEGKRRYAAPDAADLERENRVLSLLSERFALWQREGFIPSKAIPDGGQKTEEPIRTRGWTYWHHLFTPRQLLTHGLLAEFSSRLASSTEAQVGCLLGLGRMANWDSRLCLWDSSPANEKGKDVFLNQALNPLYSYSNRPLSKFVTAWPILTEIKENEISRSIVAPIDARDLGYSCDIWITDPPYADAVNYHELSDFFLAWYEKSVAKTFPEWIPDTRAELAVRGDGEDFRRSMVDIYKNLTFHMLDDGLQMVMFTHQDPAVWADLGMILWAAGLKATAAWTISTETGAGGIKTGNYVQGTVCLILRKRNTNDSGFLDEVYPLVEDEVKRQIASMQALDEGEEPNFNDADYQLAAYAAALKVLTQYGNLDGRDVEEEVFAVRGKNEKSDFQAVIERALGIACDTLVPQGLDDFWRELSLVERYYLRALDIESRGERRQGMYEELARGFGVTSVKPLLKSDKANGARMLTPSGFAATGLAPMGEATSEALQARSGRASSSAPHPFAVSPLRHLLFAIRETSVADNSPEPGRQYLRDTFGQGYWARRESFVFLLEWLSALGNSEGMNEWIADSEAARILAGRLRNDHA